MSSGAKTFVVVHLPSVNSRLIRPSVSSDSAVSKSHPGRAYWIKWRPLPSVAARSYRKTFSSLFMILARAPAPRGATSSPPRQARWGHRPDPAPGLPAPDPSSAVVMDNRQYEILPQISRLFSDERLV